MCAQRDDFGRVEPHTGAERDERLAAPSELVRGLTAGPAPQVSELRLGVRPVRTGGRELGGPSGPAFAADGDLAQPQQPRTVVAARAFRDLRASHGDEALDDLAGQPDLGAHGEALARAEQGQLRENTEEFTRLVRDERIGEEDDPAYLVADAAPPRGEPAGRYEVIR